MREAHSAKSFVILLADYDASTQFLIKAAITQLPGCVIIRAGDLPRLDLDVNFEDLLLASTRTPAIQAVQDLLEGRGALDYVIPRLTPFPHARRCRKCNARATGVTRCPRCGSDRLEPLTAEVTPSTERREAARAKRKKRR